MSKYKVLRNGDAVLDRGSHIIHADSRSAAIEAAKTLYADALAREDRYTQLYDYYYHAAANADYTAEKVDD